MVPFSGVFPGPAPVEQESKMLSIVDSIPAENCQGTSRRELLRVGSLGLLGSQLAPWLNAVAAARNPGETGKEKLGQLRNYVRDRSVVLLFLHGGPSHIEFFDPSMEAPGEIRSITGETPTRIPGMTFGGTFSKLASLADQLSIVRSYGSKNSGHTYEKVASGNNRLKAAMSAIYSRVAGNNNGQTGVPNNVIVKREAIQRDLKLGRNFESNALPSVTAAGSLGSMYEAFDPGGGGEASDNMRLKIERGHFLDRKSLLRQLDSQRRQLDRIEVTTQQEQYRRQAFEIIHKGIGEAFDLSQEPESIRRSYDTSHLFQNRDIQRYNDMKRATNLLGQQMLMARRLCQAGCGFVTVSDCGWDMHANNNSPRGMKAMWPMSQQVDHAVSAFIEDVKQQGLEEKILLIVTGEMGRTPRINGNGGRDHYGELTPLLFFGGGLKMGQVVGASDKLASRPAGTPYGPEHLFGTVMHTLFDIGQMRLDSSLPSELINVMNAAQTIEPLH